MSNITLNIEFLAGTTLFNALCEAKKKANKYDVAYICFNFNGIGFSIGKTADINKAIKEFTQEKSFICCP